MDRAAIDRFRRHADGCRECTGNAYGLCATGFALLRGAAACETSEGAQGQLALGEMRERPLVRAYLSHPPSLPPRELRRTGPPSQTGRERRAGPPLATAPPDLAAAPAAKKKAVQPWRARSHAPHPYRAPSADA